MSGSARMYIRLDCSKQLARHKKMHVYQVYCELMEHSSLMSFQSEDSRLRFTTCTGLLR